MTLRIKEVIKEKGMTIQSLAEKMEINRVGLSNHINGNPSIATLKKIASALNVPVYELFTKEKDNEVNGFIEYNKIIYKISSTDDMSKLLEKIKKERE
ncbi:helix-turn-helix domain-containing protein [Bacteroides salyersiae]|uniref:helix-turn-helix domain-containing protein n=1 Tax=Bacteroides salyersiae TaxID=291644 RepID=UPI001C38157A|nr:helix-turn-helix transcriptional regulator [Bacteroides salyersiae]MBV4206198.1 helix-turn-helix domain-containing protein [Bacteroides salyersiae]MCB6651502.1 helix-turn-helix domain-containing protein [Bacteroides salyersiae]